jgi:hypothetical protein
MLSFVSRCWLSRTGQVGAKLPAKNVRRPQGRRRPELELLEHRQLMSIDVLPHLDGLPPPSDTLEDRTLVAHVSVPRLHSLAGAPHTLYLDFTGHRYNPRIRRSHDSRPPFDMDGDLSNFSLTEAAAIRDIWTHVAEDFAPFNINVTTIQPEEGKFLRVVIGGRDPYRERRSGRTLADSADDYLDEARPICYVFSREIGGTGASFAQQVGSTAAHEAGHVLYLEHTPDFVTRGGFRIMLDEYGRGDALRTPIMGNNLELDRVMWSNALNDDRERQNDIRILRRTLGARADEPNVDFGSAQPLTPMSSWTRAGVFGVTGPTVPALGAYQFFLVGSGIIGGIADADFFSFDHATGPLVVQVNTLGNAANLDAKLELYRRVGSSWEIVDTQDPALTAPFTGLNAEVRSASLPGGRYAAVVKSHASYGDVGHYTISATVMVPPDAPRVHALRGPRFLYGPGGTHSFGLGVSFTEAIDAATFDASDVVLRGPEDELIRPLRIDAFAGAVNFVIVLPELTEEGEYHVVIGPHIRDLAGNALNQDGDYVFGENPQDRLAQSFDYRLPPPPAPGAGELADAIGLADYFGDMAYAFWDLQTLMSDLPPSLGGWDAPPEV